MKVPYDSYMRPSCLRGRCKIDSSTSTFIRLMKSPKLIEQIKALNPKHGNRWNDAERVDWAGDGTRYILREDFERIGGKGAERI